MNARRLLVTATAVLVVASVVAQQKQGHASAPFKKNQGKMSVIDSTKLRVWYAMNADSILNMDTYIDYQRLDVGDSISRYYINDPVILIEFLSEEKHFKCAA